VSLWTIQRKMVEDRPMEGRPRMRGIRLEEEVVCPLKGGEERRRRRWTVERKDLSKQTGLCIELPMMLPFTFTVSHQSEDFSPRFTSNPPRSSTSFHPSMKTSNLPPLILACCIAPCSSYCVNSNHVHSRRRALSKAISSSAAILVASSPHIACAKESPQQSDISMLKEATEVLSTLLDNWDRATIDCTYADVPRELLEAKNKDQLLEKASEFALFDKSTSVVSCKRTKKIVRDYIGATGKGPLVSIEKRLLKKDVVNRVNPENIDDYFTFAESFSQALSRANSFSYAAGVSDFDSMNNFAKDDTKLDEDGSNLSQAKKAIEEANSNLKKAVAMLDSEE
jgi:hypothetical protein